MDARARARRAAGLGGRPGAAARAVLSVGERRRCRLGAATTTAGAGPRPRVAGYTAAQITGTARAPSFPREKGTGFVVPSDPGAVVGPMACASGRGVAGDPWGRRDRAAPSPTRRSRLGWPGRAAA